MTAQDFLCKAAQGDRKMARYGKKAQQKVKQAMHERKRGTLKSGRSGSVLTVAALYERRYFAESTK